MMSHHQRHSIIHAIALSPAVLLAGFASMFVASAHASTFGRIEKTCPFDGAKIEAMVPMSGTSFGRTFDLRPVGPIIAPYPYLVCPDGFIFYKNEFSDVELKQIRLLISSREFKKLAIEPVHYRAAWLQERTGGQAQDIAYNILYASWEAKSHDEYQRHASRLLVTLDPAIFAEKDPKRNLRLKLLKGEVLRRLSQFEQAQTYFGQLAEEIGSGNDEATIIQLELAMVAARNANGATISRKALEAARSSDAWLAARQPTLVPNSLLGPVARQLRTSGARGFLWSRDSKSIHANMDGGYDSRFLERSSVTGGEATSKTAMKFGPIMPVAALPNGNLLVSAYLPLAMNGSTGFWVSDVTKGVVLMELDPATGEATHSIPWRDFYHKPALISFDGTLLLLGAAPMEIAAYSISAQATVSIPGGTERDDRAWNLLATDPNAPRLAALTRKEGYLPAEAMIVWNWEQKRRDISIPQDASDNDFRVVGAAFNSGFNELVVAREQFRDGTKCELRFYDLTTGRLRESREDNGQSASMARSPDGRYIAYGCDGKLELLDAADPSRIVETISAPRGLKFTGMQFSPDSRFIAIEIDNVVTVFAVKQ